MSRKERSDRIEYIDDLRGISAVFVMLEHVFMQILRYGKIDGVSANIMDWLANSYFSLGRFGVITFFMISGFVIPYSFKAGGRPIASFIVGRFFRLYPVYWASIILATMALGFFGTKIGVVQFVANLTMVQSLLHQEHVMGIYWTLFVEIIFYGICVALFAVKALNRPAVYLAVFLALVSVTLYKNFSVASNTHIPPGGIPYALAVMFLGALARSAFYEQRTFAKYAFPVACLLLMGSKLLLLMKYKGAASFGVLLPEFTAELVAIVVFSILSYLRPVGMGFLKYTGLISYSIYLFHGVVFTITSHVFYEHSSVVGDILFLISTIALTFIVSSLTYRFVERPSISLGRKVQRLVSPSV